MDLFMPAERVLYDRSYYFSDEAMEIIDHLADGLGLVEAGNDDCNLVLIHPEHFPI